MEHHQVLTRTQSWMITYQIFCTGTQQLNKYEVEKVHTSKDIWSKSDDTENCLFCELPTNYDTSHQMTGSED